MNFILATAGHVDHGKSSLVKALTGTDPDRLPEEKARGITIDLGFAHLDLGGKHNVGIVDVPGHEDFVKNMVAGVGSVDAALLIVAADDGWMPQTEEHFQILNYLGVTRAVVALTKIDLVQNEAATRAAIRSKLENSPFAAAPIIGTSVTTGQGLEDLRTALVALLEDTPAQRDIGKPRLSIDRVFTLLGIGVIVTGTLNGGQLRRGESVAIQPGQRRARIRGIHTYNRNVQASEPGTRTALNLSDVGIADLKRGDVVTAEHVAGDSKSWDVVLERSTRADGRRIKEGALVRVHFGSSNAHARVVFLEARNLASGERALAQLRFDESVFAFEGDRFIIRDAAEQHTLAGGTILSIDADRRRFHTNERKTFLQTRADAGDVSGYILSQLSRDGYTRRGGMLRNARFSDSEVAGALTKLTEQKSIVTSGDFTFDAKWWANLRERAVVFIDCAHKARPNETNIPINEVRAKANCPPEVFDALMADLAANGFVVAGTNICRRSHRIELPNHLKSSAEKVRAALSSKPYDPPSVREIAPDAQTQQALRFLLQSGEAVEITPEVVLLTRHYQAAIQILRDFLTSKGQATTSELRQALNSSRRVIIPLLEHLDKQSVTRREGDKRALIPSRG